MLKSIEKDKDKIKERQWNPYIITKQSWWFHDNGNQVYRFDTFLESCDEFLKEEFDFDKLPEFLKANNLNDVIYSGIANSHKGHLGISYAKLVHAVVCVKDIMFGSGNWKWDDEQL